MTKKGCTPRENQALGLLADGYTYRRIAYLMGTAENTVRQYLSRGYHKLGFDRSKGFSPKSLAIIHVLKGRYANASDPRA